MPNNNRLQLGGECESHTTVLRCRSGPMSALGQKQTYAPQKTHVRFTPNSDRKSGHSLVVSEGTVQGTIKLCHDQ